jgi:IclR family transcriptional regulator, pca regulon regulatory protein
VVAAINVSVHAASVSAERLIEVCLPALQQTQASLRSLL